MLQTPKAYVPSFSPLARLGRVLTAHRVIEPLSLRTPDFLLSVSFDDAPVSAASVGGALLEARGLRGTYYIATGLLGSSGISGPIVDAAGVRRLAALGHEIALHSHAHLDLAQMTPGEAVADIYRNIDALSLILGAEPSTHFAYPYGTTTVRLKKMLKGVVPTARGVRFGIAGPEVDRMQMPACELRPDPATTRRAREAIRTAAKKGGWVTLFTHDVSSNPSPYGVTPKDLAALVDEALELGARVLPVGQAFAALKT